MGFGVWGLMLEGWDSAFRMGGSEHGMQGSVCMDTHTNTNAQLWCRVQCVWTHTHTHTNTHTQLGCGV